jgi:hypothetical protein
MKTIKLLFALLILGSCCSKKSDQQFTNVEIKNSSHEDSVKVFVTLQSPNSVIGLFGITDTIGSCSKGYFYAKKDSSYYSNTSNELLGVVVSFVGDNVPCQVAIPRGFRWGINIFEFSINTPYEVFDISLEDGANCILKASVNDTLWTTGDKVQNIMRFDSAQNKFPIENNLNIRGVFPYRCTDCIDLGKAIPENCLNLKDACNTERICQVARTNNNGGVIKLEYLGQVQVLMK